jgi:membrane-anchored protein YejM (alkaline phosphatase superfamily)
MKSKIKQLPIPEPFRKEYKSAAYAVYAMIGQDVPEIEDGRKYSKTAVVELVRDANRLRMEVEREERGYSPQFREWIKTNEYNQQYRADMNRAVREVL